MSDRVATAPGTCKQIPAKCINWLRIEDFLKQMDEVVNTEMKSAIDFINCFGGVSELITESRSLKASPRLNHRGPNPVIAPPLTPLLL